MSPLFPRHSFSATLLRGGGLVLLLTFSLPAPAQSLRLDDLFTTRGLELQSLTLSDFEADPEKPALVMAQLRELLGENQYRAVLDASEPLAAWFDPASADYGDLLHLRARAYKGLDRSAALKNLGASYLRRFGENSPHSGWFLLEMARQALEEGNRRAAMGFWLRLLANDHPAPVEDALAGARLFLESADPARARAILGRSFSPAMETSATQRELSERDHLLLESLLMRDDRAVALPPAREGERREDVSYNLRRALLIEIRSGHGEALEEYENLRAHEGVLPSAERQLLRQRLARDESQPWPPAR